MPVKMEKWRAVTYDIVNCRYAQVDGDAILTRLQELSDARVRVKTQDADIRALAYNLGWRGDIVVDRRARQIVLQREPPVLPRACRPPQRQRTSDLSGGSLYDVLDAPAAAQVLVEASRHPMYMVDPGGRIIFANSATEEAFGVPLETLLTWDDVTLSRHLGLEQPLEAVRESVLNSGQGVIFDLVVPPRIHGEAHLIEMTFATVSDGDGEIVGAACNGEDVTDLRSRHL